MTVEEDLAADLQAAFDRLGRAREFLAKAAASKSPLESRQLMLEARHELGTVAQILQHAIQEATLIVK